MRVSLSVLSCVSLSLSCRVCVALYVLSCVSLSLSRVCMCADRSLYLDGVCVYRCLSVCIWADQCVFGRASVRVGGRERTCTRMCVRRWGVCVHACVVALKKYLHKRDVIGGCPLNT